MLALRDAAQAAENEGKGAFVHPRAHAKAWSVVHGYLVRVIQRRSDGAQGDDFAQLSILKVQRSIAGLRAETPAACEAWLRRVYQSVRIDHFRKNDVVEEALRSVSAREEGHPLERVAAPEPVRARLDEADLDVVVGRVMDEVDAFLHVHVKREAKRLGDRTRAEVAVLAGVRGHSVDEIRAQLPAAQAVSRDALYKWVERGREQVLIPTLTAWLERPSLPEDDAQVPRGLLQVLTEARRSDAGRARPQRRHGKGRTSLEDETLTDDGTGGDGSAKLRETSPENGRSVSSSDSTPSTPHSEEPDGGSRQE